MGTLTESQGSTLTTFVVSGSLGDEGDIDRERESDFGVLCFPELDLLLLRDSSGLELGRGLRSIGVVGNSCYLGPPG